MRAFSWRVAIPTFLLLACVSEFAARISLGLGNPPLYEENNKYEYRLKPNQNVVRFGNRISINSYGQRSSTLPLHRDRHKRRLLVIGDSVVWGGSLIDQQQIATELIEKTTGMEVVNISAPSWGPPNQLHYLEEHGLFDATDAVLVVSSHDAFDQPSYQPLTLSQNKPTKKPLLAIEEGLQRYLLPKLWPTASHKISDHNQASTVRSLSALVKLLSKAGVRIGVVQYWTKGEIEWGSVYDGHALIADTLQIQNITPVQSGPLFKTCGPLTALFTDDIHPYTTRGQECLARAILKALPQTNQK